MADALKKRDERRADGAWRHRFGTAVRKARKAQRYSQSDLANLVGLDAGAISDIEVGRTDPTLSTLETVADVLKLSLDDLVGRERGSFRSTTPIRSVADADVLQDAEASLVFEPAHKGAVFVSYGSGKTNIAALLKLLSPERLDRLVLLADDHQGIFSVTERLEKSFLEMTASLKEDLARVNERLGLLGSPQPAPANVEHQDALQPKRARGGKS